jgi:putative ABC transport system permease protein
MMKRRERMLRDLDQDIRNHIETETRDNIGRGMGPEDARHAAMLKFGNVTRVQEETREVWSFVWVEQLLQDLRYGLRMIWKSPGFTAVAVLTLGLGIGANTAIFSVVYAVLLRPLPYQDASRLVLLNETTPNVGTVSVSYPNFIDWRSQSHAFSQMAAVHEVGFNLTGVARPETIRGEAVSPAFLSILGVRPFLGRDFTAQEEDPGTAPVLLLSYEMWQSHLGSDPDAVGKTMSLDGRAFTVVGVLPANFRWLDKIDVIEPIGVWTTNNPDATGRGDRGDTSVVGRLAPDSSFEQARAEMEGIAARLAKEYPGADDRFGVELMPMREAFVGDSRPAILILFGAVLFVLLIACANVANLFLVRGASRTKEIALRFAFGASRGRIVRQMLAESFILAFLGGVLGLALAIGGIHAIARWIPTDMLSGATVSLNGVVFAFVAALVVVAAFVFGLAPAAHSSKADMQSSLKESTRTASASAGQNRLRAAFAVAEISLALVLLVGAGLMTKSLYRLMSVDPGFRPARVLAMEMDLPERQYSTDPAILNFWQRVLDGVRALPGVESAAVGTVVPLTGNHSRSDVTIEGMAAPRPGDYPHPDVHVVSSEYLATMGISLVRGRKFTEADDEKAPHVGMINALLARRYFADDDPVGKRFMIGHPGEKSDWMTIVGVTGDTKLYGLANPARLEIYVPFRQAARTDMNLVVKSGVGPAALSSAIREVISSVDRDQPISVTSTMEQLVSDSVATRRITLVLLGLFSGLALILAAIGIYGVISYSVAQRTHEIGIRTALGAQRVDLVRMILKQGLKTTLIGVGIGLAAALGLTQLMKSMLFGVGAMDPLTFISVAAVLVCVALAASYIPARRAMRVDPLVALKYE